MFCTFHKYYQWESGTSPMLPDQMVNVRQRWSPIGRTNHCLECLQQIWPVGSRWLGEYSRKVRNWSAHIGRTRSCIERASSEPSLFAPWSLWSSAAWIPSSSAWCSMIKCWWKNGYIFSLKQTFIMGIVFRFEFKKVCGFMISISYVMESEIEVKSAFWKQRFQCNFWIHNVRYRNHESTDFSELDPIIYFWFILGIYIFFTRPIFIHKIPRLTTYQCSTGFYPVFWSMDIFKLIHVQTGEYSQSLKTWLCPSLCSGRVHT